jgi:hypothetical protein
MGRLGAVRGTLAAMLCLWLTGCGGSSSNPTASSTPTPPPEQIHRVIVTASFSDFHTDTWFRTPVDLRSFEIPVALEITVDWTSDESWIYVYLGERVCSFDELHQGGCPFLITSETKDPKPRVLFTDPLQPGMYYLFLYNVPRNPARGIGSDVRETVSYQIDLSLTRSRCLRCHS